LLDSTLPSVGQITDIYVKSIGFLNIVNNDYDFSHLLLLKVELDESIYNNCFEFLNTINSSIGNESLSVREAFVQGKG
jgi:hypothetical protein